MFLNINKPELKGNVIQLILIALVLISACSKEDEKLIDDDKKPVSEKPYIELQSVSPTEVKAFEESIVFTIYYLDGDGDIGTSDADVNSLFIEDNRGDITIGFHIPPLAPKDTEITIEGHLNVVLDNTILFGDGSENETVIFSIYLIDRAGNKSNIVKSEEITVKP